MPSKVLNIYVFTTEYSFNDQRGYNLWFEFMLQELAARGHRITVVAPIPFAFWPLTFHPQYLIYSNTPSSWTDPSGFKVYRPSSIYTFLNKLSWPWAIAHLTKQCHRWWKYTSKGTKPDIVLTFDLNWSKPAATFAYEVGAPCICSSLGDDVLEALNNPQERLSPPLPTIVTTQNKHYKELLEAITTTGMELETAVYYRGIDLSFLGRIRSRKSVRKEMGWNSNQKILVFNGRPYESKGIFDLVRAIDLISDKLGDFRIVFQGIGHSWDESKTLMREISNRIWAKRALFFPFGRRDEALEIVNAADVLILPTWREGMPNTLLEACALGIPCVTTDIPPVREFVGDSVQMAIVPIKNPKLLSEAIEKVVNDPGFAAFSAKSARERVLKDFDLHKNIDRFEQLMDQSLRIFHRTGDNPNH